jgi:hypothetical protein
MCLVRRSVHAANAPAATDYVAISGDAMSRIAQRTTGVRFCTDAGLSECHTAVLAFRRKKAGDEAEVRDTTGIASISLMKLAD